MYNNYSFGANDLRRHAMYTHLYMHVIGTKII